MSDPSATPQARVRARRNLRLVAVGILAVCVGGLGMAWLYSSVADARSVVSVARTVYRGQVITGDDLGVLSVPAVPGLETVPADQVEQVVGQTAHTDLVAGSVLSPRSFGAAVVEAGTARLGLRLAPGRMP
ncbi:MAG: SAF domain-containing protein, partial [Propionicimonas sp.]|nr:SAF domain-containing protein [Propionicimonas sp.]